MACRVGSSPVFVLSQKRVVRRAERPAPSAATGVQRRFVVAECNVGKLIGALKPNNESTINQPCTHAPPYKHTLALCVVLLRTGCRYAGRGGATIGSVRSSSAAEVEIGARGSAAAGRTLAIRGTEEAVGMAEALVAGLVPLLAVD